MNEQTRQRLLNLEALVEAGFPPYPYRFPKTHHAQEILKAKEGASPEQEWPERVALAGRLLALRRMGKVTFAHLLDETGRIQLYFQKDLTPHYELLKKLDVGDILGVEGTLFTTKTGEVTVKVLSWTPLVKALHPLPDKWHGLKDKEVRYRQRYLDLIVNPEVREVFRRRSAIVRYIRRFFEEKGFLEVETPVLQATTGGAEARPFKTYHHALDDEFFLRISLELYLKRLLVGGYEKVYEIGRVFRNEGIDHNHNPEFTMLEAYWAYADYQDMALLVEELLSGLVHHLFGSYEVPYQGRVLNFKPPFKRLSFVEVLKEKAGLPFDPLDLERLRLWADAHHPELAQVPSYKLLDKLFGIYVEPELQDPTFVFDFPLAISPWPNGTGRSPGSPSAGTSSPGDGARPRLFRAQRPPGPKGALPGAGQAPQGRGRGSPRARRGLPPGPGARHAPGGGPGAWDRPPHHAPHRPALSKGRPPLPPDEAQERAGGARVSREGRYSLGPHGWYEWPSAAPALAFWWPFWSWA